MKLDISLLLQVKAVIYDKKNRTIQLVKFFGLPNGEEQEFIKVDFWGNDKFDISGETELFELVDKLEILLGQEFIAEENRNKIFIYRLDAYQEIMFFNIAIAEPAQNSELQ